MSFFEILDHPADLAITFKAPDLPSVYRLAALALFEILYGRDVSDAEGVISREKITGVDREELLVNWLNHLLFLHETRKLRGKKFKVELISEEELEAEVYWQQVDFAKEPPSLEIKMATYHNLEITPLGDCWQVFIIFDL